MKKLRMMTGGPVSFLLPAAKQLMLLCMLLGVAAAYTSGNCTIENRGNVYIGESAQIRVSVFNHASAALTGLKVTLGLPGSLGGPREFSVPRLEARSLYTTTVQLAATSNVTIGSYPISVKAAFQGTEEQLDGCTLTLASMPITLDVTPASQSLNPGESGGLTVSVRNTASITLRDMNISLKMPYSLRTNESAVFIQSFLPAQEVKKDYAFTANAGAAGGDYHITADVEFTDEAGGRHSLERDAAVSVGGAGGLGLLETVLIILIIVLVMRMIWGMVGG